MGEAPKQSETGCHQYWAWGSLAKGPGHPKDQGCLPASHKAQQLKEHCVVCELGDARSQEVTRVG